MSRAEGGTPNHPPPIPVPRGITRVVPPPPCPCPRTRLNQTQGVGVSERRSVLLPGPGSQPARRDHTRIAMRMGGGAGTMIESSNNPSSSSSSGRSSSPVFDRTSPCPTRQRPAYACLTGVGKKNLDRNFAIFPKFRIYQ